jgi:hypothetical protein
MSAETADDRPAGPTTRYRVRCPGCGYSDRFRSKGNAIRVQKHGCPECGRGVGVSKVRADPDNQRLVTDGGQLTDGKIPHDNPESLEPCDPDELPMGFTPAVVECRTNDGSTDIVSYANVSVDDSGGLRFLQWDGRGGWIPPWRWCELRELATTRVPADKTSNHKSRKRIVSEDRQYLPDSFTESVDRGEGIRTDGGQTVEDPGDFDPSGVTDDAEMTTFHQAVCVPCGDDGDPWAGEAHERAAFAEIERETHAQLHECPDAYVRKFESEAVGSIPREKPPVETDDA